MANKLIKAYELSARLKSIRKKGGKVDKKTEMLARELVVLVVKEMKLL